MLVSVEDRNPQIFIGTTFEILKLESLLNAYGMNRIGIDFFSFNGIFGLPPGNPLKAT